ncbi:MAG: putative toxin-antitoxin system toxin component, PIN family [Clostridiaceae bacterium]|nr:putative toxin-antitoxin system toxin component, PIN family [Clostridiaceae bacterium]
MRVMLDTNVLISLLLFPNPRMSAMMEYIFTEHELVLSSFVVDELKAVVRRKFPTKVKALDKFLLKMSYDLVYTPEEMDEALFSIRDMHDYPVLYTAIIEDVDVLITGDKDFTDVEIEKPQILTPADFMAKYL